MTNKETFLAICKEDIKRDGINDLLKWLEDSDFFTAPASTRFHGNYEGGLCEHSLNVHRELTRLNDVYQLGYSKETIAITALFHDLCKVNYYKRGTRNVKDENGNWIVKEIYEMPSSFLLYQEQEMAALNYAGIDMSDCYTAIKNIAKKRVDKVLAYKEKFINGFSKVMIEDEHKAPEEAAQLSQELWQIIEDSSRYSFNASHSYCVALDSLYGAWLKAHHPLEFYEVLLTLAEQKGDKDKMNALKEEAESYFNIKFPPFRFGQDNRSIKADIENNLIVNSLSAIKGFSLSVGTALYDCSKNNFTSFVDVLAWLDKRALKASKVRPLITIDYFQQFGNINELLAILDMWELFKQGEAKSIKKDKITSIVVQRILENHCSTKNKDGSNSAAYKMENDQTAMLCLYDFEQYIKQHPIKAPSMKEQIQYSMDVLGYADVVTNREEDRRRLLITDVIPLSGSSGEVWSYRVGTRSLGSGKTARLTVKANIYDKKPIKAGDIVYAADLYKNQTGYWYLLAYNKEA